jgi:hypothetical protein
MAATSEEGEDIPSETKKETSKAQFSEKNGDTSLGYSGRIYLRREQCSVETHC